jgi:hypothetical protein
VAKKADVPLLVREARMWFAIDRTSTGTDGVQITNQNTDTIELNGQASTNAGDDLRVPFSYGPQVPPLGCCYSVNRAMSLKWLDGLVSNIRVVNDLNLHPNGRRLPL